MSATIAIIGLGQIGGSIGLALKARGASEKLVGHDKDRRVSREAESIGAVNSTAGLKDALKNARLVFLCLPLGEMREVLVSMGPALQEGAVVVDTAPIKARVALWVEEFLPGSCQHVGIVPAPGPAALAATELGIKAADADLFRRTTMMVVSSPRTSDAAEQLGMNIARMLGAKPMLTDPAEADGIMTSAHILPQLTSAALLEACTGASGWADARKLAGRPFTTVSGGLAYYDDPVSIQTASLSTPSRVVHALDGLIASLQGLKNDIQTEDAQSLEERLTFDYRNREHWLDERMEAPWIDEGHEPVGLPGLGEQITQMFLGGRIAETARSLEGKRRHSDRAGSR